MKTAAYIKHTLPLIGLLTLTACGGGSSDSTPTTPNVSPSATAQTHVIDEDVNLALTLSGTDSDGSITSYTVTTQPASGSLTGTGANLIYTPNLNFNGNDSLSFTVTDNDGATSNAVDIDITINAINDAPVIALNDSYDISENTSSTSLLLTLYATDPELDDISVSLGQEADTGLFNIDSETKELLFNISPDFENPTDSDADNNYQVSVTYTDSHGAENSTLINIDVSDESEVLMIMTFPTPNANLGGVTEITLRGTITDTDGNELETTNVSDITVNGVKATLMDSSTDWSVTLPASEKNIDLAFEVISDSHAVFNSTQQLSNTVQPVSIENPFDGGYDSENNRLIFIDSNFYNAIMALDLNTNKLSVLSDESRGTGTSLEYARGMALDVNNNRAFVSDLELDAIYMVDLTTGNRTIISDNNTGTGTEFSLPRGLQYDVTNNQLYLIDSGSDALIKVDLTTGDRTIISNDYTGSGDTLNLPYGLEVDVANNSAYIADLAEDKVFAINLTTGARTTIASPDIGTGVAFSEPRNLALNSDKTSLYLAGQSSDSASLIELDLTTLNRTILSNQDIGTGVNFKLPNKIIVDQSAENIWVLDSSVEGIISTNLSSGNRELLIDPDLELNFLDPKGLVWDANNNLLAIDEEALLKVDISGTTSTGNISVLSDSEVGTGLSLVNTDSVAYDEANNHIYTVTEGEDDGMLLVAIDTITGNRTQVVDFQTYISTSEVDDFVYDHVNNRIIYIESSGSDTLVSVDLSTGSFTQISDFSTDETFVIGIAMALDIENNTVYIAELYTESIYSVDLTSGITTLFSGADAGTGPEFSQPYGIMLDASNNQLLVADSGVDQIISVNLTTGNRTTISESTPNVEIRGVNNPVLDSENNRLFIPDLAEDNIYVIDLETGERAYVTH